MTKEPKYNKEFITINSGNKDAPIGITLYLSIQFQPYQINIHQWLYQQMIYNFGRIDNMESWQFIVDKICECQHLEKYTVYTFKNIPGDWLTYTNKIKKDYDVNEFIGHQKGTAWKFYIPVNHKYVENLKINKFIYGKLIFAKHYKRLLTTLKEHNGLNNYEFQYLIQQQINLRSKLIEVL